VNAGFNVNFDVTCLHVVLALFILGCVSLAGMILFEDYKLAGKAVKCLSQGFCSVSKLRPLSFPFELMLTCYPKGSKVLWTLLFSATMYLTYDTLTEDPVALAAMELLFLDAHTPDFVARFVRTKVMSWRSPLPKRPNALWLLGELFGDTYQLQQKDQFTPKTLTELLVGSLVGLYRLARAHFNVMTTPGSAIWSWARPRVTATGMMLLDKLPTIEQAITSVVTFAPTLWRWLQSYLRYRYEEVILPAAYFLFVIGCYICKRNSGGGLDDCLAGSWDYMGAIMEATTLSKDDIAKLLMEKATLKKKLDNALPDARQQAALEAQASMKEVAHRCISWRTSHEEVVKDYNHARRTICQLLGRWAVTLQGKDPFDTSSYLNQIFTPNTIMTTDDPGENGLHYKTNPLFKGGAVMPDVKERCDAFIYRLLYELRHNKKPTHFTFPPRMDPYDEETWAFDLTRIGFTHAWFAPESNPIDLSKRRAIPVSRNSLEDYALAGRLQFWHAEEAERKSECARLMAHPFATGLFK